MTKFKKLISTSIIFAIGNFGSKIISIVLVPLYTYYLSSAEYGTIDIVTTTTGMLFPIISLSIYDAVFRFAMDKNVSKQSVLTNALAVTILGVLISLLFYPVLGAFKVFDEILKYLYIILILQAFQGLLADFTRGIGKVKIFAINGIIQTLTLSVSNILLLVIFDKGVDGYFLSIIISNAISILFFVFTTNIFGNISMYRLSP